MISTSQIQICFAVNVLKLNTESSIRTRCEASQPKSLKNPKCYILFSQSIHCPEYTKQNTRGIILLNTYCSSSRIHLIGSKIVQSILSHGRIEAGRSDWSSVSTCVVCFWECMYVCEQEISRRGKLLSFLCGPVTLTAAVTSVQHQWQLTANKRKGRSTVPGPPLGKRTPLPPLVLFPTLTNKFCCFFLLIGKNTPLDILKYQIVVFNAFQWCWNAVHLDENVVNKM